MAVIRWDPFRELGTLQDRMNRLFEDANGGSRSGEPPVTTAWSPAVDIHETEHHIVVKAEVPGMERDDIELGLENNVLTLKGNRRFEKDTKEENYHRIERAYGSFSRSFSIPSVVDEDKISADYKEGVLTITLPKTEKAKAKQIAIGK
jgi:HSP20 family protein